MPTHTPAPILTPASAFASAVSRFAARPTLVTLAVLSFSAMAALPAHADDAAARPAPPPPASAPTAPSAAAPAQAPNTLTPAERAAGWTLLFDGATTAGWRGYKQPAFPAKGWVVVDGTLRSIAGGGGGDIVTDGTYGDFELELDYRCTPKANSGIIFRVAEKHSTTWQTGPEFQILDDLGHGVKPDDAHSAGALYDLAPPAAGKISKPAGEWNRARIVLKDGRLRHWLNGTEVVDLRVDGDDWKSRIAKSKFSGYEGFGVQPTGHLALQEHGDEVWFRNIKLRDLSKPMPGERALFNGQDLAGWAAHLNDGGTMGKVWTVKDGVLNCAGTPIGYVHTVDDFANYVLKLEWRWPAGKQPGNSGVLLRKVGEDKVWPKSVEAQLQSGSAGDFWCIEEFPMKTDAARVNGRNTRKTHGNENPVGEWNEYEIVVDGDRVRLMVNGELLNEAWGVQEVPGKICLQSEGAEIEFRRVRLAPIERP